MTAREILSKLSDVKVTSSGWQARCPAHDDGTASLSVSEGTDHRILLHCHAGCSPESVVGAMDLKLADLFNGNGASGPKPSEMLAAYDYIDATGNPSNPSNHFLILCTQRRKVGIMEKKGEQCT